MASDQDDNKDQKEKGHLFDDISAAQVIATALAAVTSMLLASYIGIAGSVIGVAVASIVSTLAASAYKKFLRDSANKIREIPLPAIREGKMISLGEAVASKEQRGRNEDLDRSDTDDAAEDGVHELKDGRETEKSEGVPEAKRESEKQPVPQRKVMRGLIAVCIISALLAVAASGAVVYLLTTGNGLGAKPQVVYVHTPADTSDEDRGESARSNGSSADVSDSGSDQSSAEKSESDQSDQSDQNGTDGTQSNSDSANTNASGGETTENTGSTSPSGSEGGSGSGSNASGSNAAVSSGSSAGSKPSGTTGA